MRVSKNPYSLIGSALWKYGRRYATKKLQERAAGRPQGGAGNRPEAWLVSAPEVERAGVSLDALHPELLSRVMAATAHAAPRVIRQAPNRDGVEQGFDVHALAGDRLVCMSLALRTDGSVDETTRTFLPGQIADVSVSGEIATVTVDEPSGRERLDIPIEVGVAVRQVLTSVRPRTT